MSLLYLGGVWNYETLPESKPESEPESESEPQFNYIGNGYNDDFDNDLDYKGGNAETQILSESESESEQFYYKGGNEHALSKKKSSKKEQHDDKIMDTSNDYDDEIEHLNEINNVYYNDLMDIYDSVINFIKKKRRILVGGMSMDYSLKSKGSFLYKTNKIDYDFISPEYFHDAYELGEILAKKYNNISIICARHISTMRVRYNFITVADITYVPNIIYTKIKTLSYTGIILVHPLYQQIDQWLSIRNLLEMPPNESYLTDRIKKDVTRFLMLNEYFPIEVNKPSKIDIISIDISKKNIPYPITGIHAAILYLHHFKIHDKNLSEIKITENKDNITITYPNEYKLSYLIDYSYPDMSNDKYYDKLNEFNNTFKKTKNKNIIHYAPILDKIFERYHLVSENIDLYNIYGSKIYLNKICSIDVDSLYGTLVWLSSMWLWNEDMFAGYVYKLLVDYFIKNVEKCIPTFDILYGKENFTTAQLLYKLKEDTTISNKLLPKNGYLQKGDHISPDYYKFNINDSILLKLDGSTF